MAQKAEEYGSHPTTFQMAGAGVVRYILANGDVLHEHHVEKGDIWRSSSTNKAPIEDWVRLGLARQRASGAEAVFWLNEDRPHDAEIIVYVKAILVSLVWRSHQSKSWHPARQQGSHLKPLPLERIVSRSQAMCFVII